MWNRNIKENAKKIIKDNKLPDKFCIMPWVGIETNTDASSSICCVMEEPLNTIDLTKNTISDAWTSDHVKEIRKSFLNGELRESCRNCWYEEESNITSKREIELCRYKDDIVNVLNNHQYPKHLDLKLGNICNAKCRICSSKSSTLWAKEVLDKKPIAKFHLEKGRWPRINHLFWEDLSDNIEHVANIDFFGGEPLLINHKFILEKCIKQGIAKNINLSYNTNGSIYKPELIPLWKEFKSVQLLFSIDGIGSRFTYLRHPAKWQEVEQNIFKYKEHVKSVIFCTISAFNIWYLDEICDWQETVLSDVELHFNKVFEPKQYSTKCLPLPIKNKIVNHYFNSVHLDKIKPWLDFMFTEQYDIKYWQKHLKMREESDLYRNEKYSDLFTEFYNIQKEYI